MALTRDAFGRPLGASAAWSRADRIDVLREEVGRLRAQGRVGADLAAQGLEAALRGEAFAIAVGIAAPRGSRRTLAELHRQRELAQRLQRLHAAGVSDAAIAGMLARRSLVVAALAADIDALRRLHAPRSAGAIGRARRRL